MKSTTLLFLFVLFGLAACNPAASAPTATMVPTAAAKTGTLRINLPTNAGIADIPVLMALDALKSQGYTVETADFAQFELLTAALVKGDLDIASGGNEQTWAAISKGAPIRTIIGWNTDPYYMVSKQELQDCAALTGKVVAMNIAKGTFTRMFDQYVQQHCPGTTPQIIVIQSANNRVPALLSGQVDAALLKLDGKLEVERQAPGKFHPLMSFNKEFPQLLLSGYHVRREFGTQHPEIVKDLVRAVVEASRRIQDKQSLYAAIAKFLPTTTNAQAVADAYLAEGTWDLNGGWTPERIQATLEFAKKANVVPAELKAEDVTDLSYLNAVLDEIGRK